MSIGIVGAGISGLHLALRLQQFGVDTTLYTPQRPEDIRDGPPLNFVTRFHSTREREKALGVTHWTSGEFDNPSMHMYLEGSGGLSFQSRLPHPASSVDFRMYLAALLEEYQARGGGVEPRETTGRSDLADLAGNHDLVVVAAGRGALTGTFPRDPARSPYDTARRRLAGGLFHGVLPADPVGMTMHMVPGAGEIHAPTYHTFGGQVTVVLVEAVPGGPFESVTGRDHRDDPDGFAGHILRLVGDHAPTLRERIDEQEFALVRPVDMLQGAVVPTVRHGWAKVGDDRFALAVGDAWIANDPLTAQGANLGSAQAFLLAEALRTAAGPYDERFCRTVSERMWADAQPVVDWTNMFIGDPPPQVTALFAAAAADQRVADAFVENLDRPHEMWHSVRTPENTEEFISGARLVRSGT
ncbi:styrene monooxygenase/indole monooxygenase family protein [Streptosporangium sp. NPDC020072]|uniref:styrene monooxygenase/indole monooxygenase family protein n=1 Tax=Streptosporangium sp. NPDC020072 TaxID=3154788 RepID=UPI00342A1C3A